MAKEFYLPTREADLMVWMANFAAKIIAHGPPLGATVGELSTVAADNLVVQALIPSVQRARDDATEWVAFKRQELHGPEGGVTPTVPGSTPIAISPVPAGILIRLGRLVRKLKASPAYTDAIGADLGIVGATITPSSPIKPEGSAAVSGPHEVKIKWVKGQYTGVVVECQRAAETAWTVLGTDNFSPYLDGRPLLVPGQPEERRYRLRYLDGDELVGEYSDVMSATAA